MSTKETQQDKLREMELEMARRAFSNHVLPGFKIRELKYRTGSKNPTVIRWDIEYSDGSQLGGCVYLGISGNYTCCIMKKYDPSASWTYPHEWHYGVTCEIADIRE